MEQRDVTIRPSEIPAHLHARQVNVPTFADLQNPSAANPKYDGRPSERPAVSSFEPGTNVIRNLVIQPTLHVMEFSAGRVSIEFDGSWFTVEGLFDAVWRAAKVAADAEQPSKPPSPEAQTTLRAIEQVRAEAAHESSKPLAAVSTRLKAKGTGA